MTFARDMTEPGCRVRIRRLLTARRTDGRPGLTAREMVFLLWPKTKQPAKKERTVLRHLRPLVRRGEVREGADGRFVLSDPEPPPVVVPPKHAGSFAGFPRIAR